MSTLTRALDNERFTSSTKASLYLLQTTWDTFDNHKDRVKRLISYVRRILGEDYEEEPTDTSQCSPSQEEEQAKTFGPYTLFWYEVMRNRDQPCFIPFMTRVITMMNMVYPKIKQQHPTQFWRCAVILLHLGFNIVPGEINHHDGKYVVFFDDRIELTDDDPRPRKLRVSFQLLLVKPQESISPEQEEPSEEADIYAIPSSTLPRTIKTQQVSRSLPMRSQSVRPAPSLTSTTSCITIPRRNQVSSSRGEQLSRGIPVSLSSSSTLSGGEHRERSLLSSSSSSSSTSSTLSGGEQPLREISLSSSSTSRSRPVPKPSWLSSGVTTRTQYPTEALSDFIRHFICDNDDAKYDTFMSWLKAIICNDIGTNMSTLPLLCFKSRVEKLFESFLDILKELVESNGIVKTVDDANLDRLTFRLGRAKVTKYDSYENRIKKYKQQFPLRQHLFIFFTFDESYENVKHVAGTRMIFGSDPSSRDFDVEMAFVGWLSEVGFNAHVGLYQLVKAYSS